MPSRRKQLEASAHQQALSLGQAASLVAHLRAGGELEPAACAVRLDPGEVAYLNTTIDLYQYSATQVPYQHSTFIAGGPNMVAFTAAASIIGNARRRRAAETAAAAQWRWMGRMSLLVTDRRLFACDAGRWVSWWYGGIRQVLHHLPQQPALDLLLDDCPPTRLQGFSVPTIAVMVVYLLYGQHLTWSEPQPARPRRALPPGRGH